MDLGAANRKLRRVSFVAKGSVIKSQGVEVNSLRTGKRWSASN